MPQFVRDVEEIRQRAIQKIEDGPVTQSYGLDKDRVITILNEALATEIVCVLRYMHHYFMATGVHGKSVADEFKEHADAEREHADQIAERISQLGGKPDFNPRSLMERSVSQYVEGETLADMIREDLIAERIVIEVYSEMIRFFGDKDSTTRVMIEGILTDEEEHADDLADLLYIVDPRSGETEGQDPGTNPLSIQPRQNQAETSREQQRSKQRPEGQPREQLGAAGRAPSGGERDTSRNVQKGETRPARATGQERPAAGRGTEIAPAHEPGTSGRPPRKGADTEVYEEDVEVRAGAEAGRSRSAHVTNPSRKRKKIA
jgi:bacterioferritin